MRFTIETTDGDAGWPQAEGIDRVCYTPEVMAKVVWRDVTWAHADKRIFVHCEGEAVCHVGVFLRQARDGDRTVKIGGVGGVMTLPARQGKGFASEAMREAARLMRNEGCDFGLLFCEPHNVAFYENLGWRVFAGEVFCEQPAGRVRFDLMHAMNLSLFDTPKSKTIDLCGLPW
jgi:aminoglycoside 2'-N-acetyltransferase I